MSLLLFEGIAGTGKTTRLIQDVKMHISENPLCEYHRVLALTKMHGSRKRMGAKLSSQIGLGRCTDCITIDSFARGLVRRWRGLLQTQLSRLPSDGDFQSISKAAGHLLDQFVVRTWVAHRYPVILIDELQDCKGGEIEILRSLAAVSKCFCAADEFQDLSGVSGKEALSWARGSGNVKTLSFVHRTSEQGLLDAAKALRNGDPIPTQKTLSFEICSVATAAQGGGVVVWRIKNMLGKNASQIAIISPTKRGTSPFVDNLLAWVSSRTSTAKKSGATAGPYSISWENSDDEVFSEILTSLELSDDSTCELDCCELANAAGRVKVMDVQNWLLKQHKLGGIKTINNSEVCSQIRRIVQRRRAFGYVLPKKRFALTVHQAKNREFDSVIVLWPMKLRDVPEQNRRLLYNAITRAKKRAVVVVEDPKRNRLSSLPFSGM